MSLVAQQLMAIYQSQSVSHPAALMWLENGHLSSQRASNGPLRRTLYSLLDTKQPIPPDASALHHHIALSPAANAELLCEGRGSDPGHFWRLLHCLNQWCGGKMYGGHVIMFIYIYIYKY